MLGQMFGKLLCAVGWHRYVNAPGHPGHFPELVECARCKRRMRFRLPNPPPPPVQPWQVKLWEERERAKHMREEDLLKNGTAKGAMLIRVTRNKNFGGSDPGTLAIVIRLGEGLCGPWQSGDLIAFWQDGEHTCLDGLEFEIVVDDLFSVADKGRR